MTPPKSYKSNHTRIESITRVVNEHVAKRNIYNIRKVVRRIWVRLENDNCVTGQSRKKPLENGLGQIGNICVRGVSKSSLLSGKPIYANCSQLHMAAAYEW